MDVVDVGMVDDKVVDLLCCFGFQSYFDPQNCSDPRNSVVVGLVSKKDWDDTSNWYCRCYLTLYCRTSHLLIQGIDLGRPSK